MRADSQARRVAKWGGASACLLLVAAVGLSCFWSVVYVHGGWFLGVGSGMVGGGWVRYSRVVTGTYITRRPFGMHWWPQVFGSALSPGGGWVGVPLWIPLIVAITGTFWMWQRDRHVR